MQPVKRLVKQFVPENYKLSMELDRAAKKFYGTVTITGIAKTDTITLHTKDLDIGSVTLDGKNADFNLNRDDDEIVISHKDLQSGNHITVIKYSGTITDSLHGIYPCHYKYEGRNQELIVTQFESHHAREAFPCVDEPEAKATFDVSLTTETGICALSNMPVHSKSTQNNKLVTTFETTPIMSTYLVAFVVGDLHKKSSKTKGGVEVNVWATPAQPADSLDFALDIATRTIDFFDDYYQTPYPLPKCDHVALPDFGSAAMENWGLVTYRDMALLVDPKNSSVSSKQYVATVITHELSHQWFGNLVTMEWWNDLWLNESFASLVEYTAVDALEPTWNIWKEFVSNESVAALRRDSLAGVQPVQTDVAHPDEIGSLFDGAIVYAKGARLLRMLEKYIGENAFRQGLEIYFKKYAYKNTVAVDLWKELETSSNKNISKLMGTWISQPGYPVVDVERDNDKIILTQNRLASWLLPESDALWPITLNSNYKELSEVFETRTATYTVGEDKPLLLNIGAFAHFITNYSPDLFNQITEQIKTGELSVIDRLELLIEQSLLARSGLIPNDQILTLLNAYHDEDDESVWDIISLCIGELKRFVHDDEDAEDRLRDYSKQLATNQYVKLGWEPNRDEKEEDTKLRTIIISLMLYSEDPDAIKKAHEIFCASTIEEINPDLRGLIIANEVKHYNANSLINDLVNKYKTTNSCELEQDIRSGLTSTKDDESIDLLLKLIKDTSVIRTQDSSFWLVHLLMNRYSRDKAWKWLRENWDWIKETFGSDKSYDHYPRYAGSTLSTKEQLNEYIQFFEPMKSDPALTRTIEVGINDITNRALLIERDKQAVKKALSNL